MAAAAPTMDASTAAHRGAGDTGGERKGEDGTVVAGRQRMAWFSAQVVAARLARSVSQHHPAVQGHGHGATQLILASTAGPQRPTCLKRFLSVSVELLTLLELWSVVAEQVVV